MSSFASKQRAQYADADLQRRLCAEWLVYLMRQSSVRTRTKDELRNEAIERLGVSKNSFDAAWVWAIEETGNHHWYDPLPRSRQKETKTRLI